MHQQSMSKYKMQIPVFFSSQFVMFSLIHGIYLLKPKAWILDQSVRDKPSLGCSDSLLYDLRNYFKHRTRSRQVTPSFCLFPFRAQCPEPDTALIKVKTLIFTAQTRGLGCDFVTMEWLTKTRSTPWEHLLYEKCIGSENNYNYYNYEDN